MRLTLPQQDIYFEQLLYPNDPIYNIGAKIKIEGNVNFHLFNRAYQQLILQHDTYRTVYNEKEGDVIASVLSNFDEDLQLLDFTEKENPDEEANTFMQKEFVKPFNVLSGSLLHKFILVKISSTEHYLFSVYHHIITDGWGTSLMFQRLVKNYNELSEQGRIISEYPFNYKDFVEDDIAYQNSDEYLVDKKYWLEKFETLPENLFEKINPNDKENKSNRKAIFIKRDQYNKLSALTKEFKASTFHAIFAILYLYFARKHRNNDFVIGLPVLNRSKSIFKKTVGLFMGISPLRIQTDYNSLFSELITNIRGQLRQDYRHRRFPLGKLVQELNSFQESGSLFNITLSYEKHNYANHFQNTKTTVIPLTHQSERVALALYIREFDENEDVKIDFDYNLNYFDNESISEVTDHFQTLLNDVLDNPNKKLYEFNYLSGEEKETLIYGFNETEMPYPKSKTFLDIFEERVRQFPNRIAVEDENTYLSYLELQMRANDVAQNLLMQDPESDSIGVLLDRSVHTIVVLLGILKAGKSYVPLDPTFPYNRLEYIINHSGLKTIISDQKEVTSFENCNTINLEEIIKGIEKNDFQSFPKVQSNDTAYIIYTSGSTGNPKGVEIGHQSLLNFLLSIQEKPGIDQDDLLFAVTTYSFDISILEFFVPLVSGASVYIASNNILNDYSKAIEAIKKVSPSIIQATPSFYQMLINGGWQGNKNIKILCGGDLLSEGLATHLLVNNAELWNMYGPTETTIWSSVKKITLPKEASNIGKPISNTQLYVLDQSLQLLPVGSSGTLYIGGDGLAKGYYKDEELTHEKFINNPYGLGNLYNTNDLVRWNNKGELVFLGRNDNQVKIRGFRIELGDIETKLNKMPEVQKAVVIAKKQQKQEAFLIAYIQKTIPDYNLQDILPVLEKELPPYMIPYALIEVDDFPLTPNKKINRKELSERAIKSDIKSDVFPQTVFQKELADIWKAVLNLDKKIALGENFFALGGHSLNAVRLAHSINKKYGCNTGLKTIFDYPTIASLSGYLKILGKQESIQIPVASSKKLYPVTPSQYQLWVASQTEEKAIAYNMVAAYEINGNINTDKIKQSISNIISKNEILRTNFVEKEGAIYQKIKATEAIDFNISITQCKKGEANNHIEKYVNESFNLEEDLLIKIMLIQTTDNSSIIVFCTHHIILDGLSLEFLSKQFIDHYQENAKIEESNKIQFKDYSEWYSNSLDYDKSHLFWEECLTDYQVKESFYVDKEPSNKNNYNGAHYHKKFTLNQTNSLKQLAQQYQNTTYNVLLTLVNAAINIISEHKDIIVGTVSSGRNIESINSMIGMFVKTLPLRIKLDENLPFLKILQDVKDQMALIDEHQDIPPSIIKEDVFDLLITYQNPDFSYQEEIRLDEFTLKYYSIDTKYSRIPILLNFFEVDGLLNITLSYNTDLYEETTISVVLEVLNELFELVVKNPSLKLSELKAEAYQNKLQKKVDFDFNF